jgi:hypothetical protein
VIHTKVGDMSQLQDDRNIYDMEGNEVAKVRYRNVHSSVQIARLFAESWTMLRACKALLEYEGSLSDEEKREDKYLEAVSLAREAVNKVMTP